MAGINVGPTGGFMSRMRQGLPGAINAVGSAMPGPFGQTSRITGSMNLRPKQTNPQVQGKQTTLQNGPGGMNPTGPSPANTGIVRGPSMPQFKGGVMGPGGVPMNGNTGITGGMFGGMGGFQNLFRPQPAPQPGPDMPNVGGGGLWSNYGALTGEMGVPRRQLYY